MSKNEVLAPSIFLLVFSSSMISSRLVVFGSPDTGPSFKRPDPLRHFKYYRGGYDLRNKHYWASAAFTGAHGYAIAGLWMLCGVGFGVYVGVRNSHEHSAETPDNSKSNHRTMLILVVVVSFTFLAIVASIFALATNGSSLQKAKKLKQTILEAGEEARRSIRKIIEAMTDMQYLLLPYDRPLSSRLNTTVYRLGNESRGIGEFLRKNGHTFDLATKTSYITHLVVIIANLILLGVVLVLLVLHWYPRLIIIIFFCWILTTLLWTMYGVDFFFNTFAEDTCLALEDFEQQQPHHNSSLNSILPCMNSSYEDKTMVEIGSNIYKYVNQLNCGITQFFRSTGSNKQVKDKLGVPSICNPFSGPPKYKYEPNNCSKNAIPISNLPNVLASFTCFEDSTEKCKGNGKFLPEASYYQVWACSRAVQDLLDVYPDLQKLSECTFVKDRIRDVIFHQCKPIKLVTRLLGLSTLCLSIFMVVLISTWALYISREGNMLS